MDDETIRILDSIALRSSKSRSAVLRRIVEQTLKLPEWNPNTLLEAKKPLTAKSFGPSPVNNTLRDIKNIRSIADVPEYIGKSEKE